MLSVFMCLYQNLVIIAINAMLIVEKHCSDICCDKFPVPQIDRKVNK